MKTIIKRFAKMSMIVMLTLYIGTSFAQNGTTYLLVNGVIKDSKTKQKIVFASISVPGTNIGTVANSDGEFTLKILKSFNATEFEISHLGYQNKKFSIAEFAGKANQTFLVDPYSVELQELVVKPVDARSIVIQAMNKVGDNYSKVPNILTGFYRETIKQRKEYVSISEAIIDIYKSPYDFTFDTDRLKIYKGRKSPNVKKADTLAVKLVGGPNISLLLDIVKNPDVLLSKESIDFYTYEILDIVNIDNKRNYVIGFTPVVNLSFPLYYGKLYISTDKLAFTMAEFSLDLKDENKAAQNFVKKKPIGLKFVPVNTSYFVTYKESDGVYYINYVRDEIKFSCDWKRRIFKTNYTVMSEMAVTERKSEGIEKFTAKESFKPYIVLADKVQDYFDESFWGEYNTIVPDESIQSAINKFNKRLKKQ
ncbi:MAG: carboxypeptidase-like regulatory domain-containing protein [Tenuifilaceae bacterium]